MIIFSGGIYSERVFENWIPFPNIVADGIRMQ
jgi:hypothetical protein